MISPRLCSFTTKIQESSGLYFDKLLDVKFSNSEWNVITYLDIGHIQPNLDKVDFLLEKVTLVCNGFTSTKVQTDCLNSLSALRNLHVSNIKKFSSISYLISNENTTHKRVKRGFMDFGGSVLKTFFGTLDSDDALKFTDAINQVQSDEKVLSTLMKDNIHVIKSSIGSFNNTISKVEDNEKKLLLNLQVIQKSMDYITNTNDKLEIKSYLSSLITSLESIIMSLSFDIDDINNAILFAKLNILHPTVLSPHQLYSELDNNRNNLPRHNDLPTSLSLQNVHDIIDISNLVCYYHFNRIIIIIKIPLVIHQSYNLYKVIPLPTPYDTNKPNTYALIQPSSLYVAITPDRMLYSPIVDIDKCKLISNKCYVCELTSVYSTLANPTCETILLSDVVIKLPKICDVRILHGSIDVFHKLNNNQWLFVQSDPGKCHVSCNNDMENSETILFGTGILSLPKNCKAFYKTLQLTSTSDFTINSTAVNTLSNFNIIIDDCCEINKINKTLEMLPFKKLDNLNNMDSLMAASISLDELEKQLNKLDNPSHLDRYGFHYLSTTYVLAACILIYLLFKNKLLRKKFCKKSESKSHESTSCCIQIFNQCSNKDYSSRNNVPVVITKEEHNTTPIPLKRNIISSTSDLHAE